jgi:hypothetical protein
MRIVVRLALGLALFGAIAAHAGEGEEEGTQSAPETRFEVTPFLGYRFGGEFDLQGSSRGADLDDHGSFALALDLRRDESSQYELFYSRQKTNLEPDSPLGELGLDVEYLHIGGTLVLDEEQFLKPYLIGTLGLTRFTPEPGRVSDNTRFSVSLGAGMRVPVTDHFGLRLEARGYLTLVDTDSSVFCASTSAGGFCAIRARGSTFVQYELLAGAAFSF